MLLRDITESLFDIYAEIPSERTAKRLADLRSGIAIYLEHGRT